MTAKQKIAFHWLSHVNNLCWEKLKLEHWVKLYFKGKKLKAIGRGDNHIFFIN